MHYFLKMHGAGNDFVLLVDELNVDREIIPDPETIRLIANRRLGVGCDQLVVLHTVETSNIESVAIRLRFFNADGHEADACGNGTRCAAWWYMRRHRLSQLRVLVGLRELAVWQDNDQVWVDMGSADFSAESVGFQGEGSSIIDTLGLHDLPLHRATIVAMPNPHLVLHLSTPPTDTMVAAHGARLETHTAFAYRANIGFLWQESARWFLRVWERGAGETLACGSGACAAFAALDNSGLHDFGRVSGHHSGDASRKELQLTMLGGVLSLAGQQQSIHLSGPVALMFSGEWYD